MGVKAVEELGKENLPAQIELFDAGTAFPTLFYQLLGFDKLIIIDAITGNGPAGTVYRLELDEVMGNPDAPLTLHDIGVIETLRLQSLVSKIPEEIVFLGMKPARIEPSLDLSPIIEAKLQKLVRMVLQELGDNGIREE